MSTGGYPAGPKPTTGVPPVPMGLRSRRCGGKHRTGTTTVKRIRLRLHLERNLPSGMAPTEANMLLHYGGTFTVAP